MLHCQGPTGSAHIVACDTFDKVGADVERLAAQRTVERADRGSGPAARALYEAAAKSYSDIFQSRCEVPIAGGKPVRIAHCDELGYEAARAFRAAGEAPLASSALRRLVSFDDRTRGRSTLAKKAAYELGATYQSLAMYALAADECESYHYCAR